LGGHLRKIAPLVVFLTVLGALIGIGTALGWSLGQGVVFVRNIWPEPAEEVIITKVAPPRPATPLEAGHACPASSLRLELYANTLTLVPGTGVTFEALVTNVGRVPCTANVGWSAADKHIQITSTTGELVFDSAHCHNDPRHLLLAVGQQEQQEQPWSGRVSVPGSCTTGQQLVIPGTYYARLLVAGVEGAVSESLPITVTAHDPAAQPPTGDEENLDPPVTG